MSAAVIFVLLISSVLLIDQLDGIPVRGNARWTMLLCRFRENSFTPHPKEWFEHWLTDENLDGTIASYFRKVSNGLYSIAESKVYGWFELPQTKDEVAVMAAKDDRLKDYADSNRRLYLKTKDVCSDYARRVLSIDLPLAKRVITVVNDEDTAVFCKENGVLVAPRFMMTAAVTHEMVHSFFLGHSYSDLQVRVFNYSEPGEYDDRYDLMSTANAFMIASESWGSYGPGLIGPHLDYLGWLPWNRVFYFGRDSNPAPSRIIRMSSLSRPHKQTTDWLLLMIPYDRDDPQKVYTVELRTKEHLDGGIPRAAIVVHQIWRKSPGGFLYSKVLNQGGTGPDYELMTAGAEWLVFLDRQFGYRYIRLRVDWINESSATAQLIVHSSFSPTACKKSETQRLAFRSDLQCATIEERATIYEQNVRRPSTESEPGRCLDGYVLRGAGVEDDICVTEEQRRRVVEQNERWKQYKDFYTSQSTFGLNSCKPGYVWRQIDPYDYVCVEYARKDEIKRQNADDRLKRATFVSECFTKFVPRRAHPTDDTCVTQEERVVIEEENRKSIERLAYARFFNGEDKVE